MPFLRSDYIPLSQWDNDWSTNKEEESEALYVHHYSAEEAGGSSYNTQSAEKKSIGSDPTPFYHQYQVSCAMLGSGHNTYTEWNSFLSADRYAFSRPLLKRPGFKEPFFESGGGHIMPDSMSPISALQRQSSVSSLTESLVLSDVPLSSLINPSASYNASLYEDVAWKPYDRAPRHELEEEEGSSSCQSWAQQTEQSYNMQLTLALRLMADAERMEEPYMSVESFKDTWPPPASQNSVEATAYRFWVTSRLGYGDRIQDGFYQIWGINPHIWSICNNEKDGLLPSLDSLYSVDPTKAAIEVILVDKHVDDCLAGLVSEALSIAQETSDSKELAEHLGKIVCEVMGGAASLEDGELKARWNNTSKMLKARFGHIVFPIGSLSVGLCRHRALLFKVLADTTSLPCRIAKGCRYCSVDCSASCLVVCETDREFLVDLIANPGALCSLESVVTRFPAVGITSPLRFPPLNTLESSSDSMNFMDYSPESSPGVLHPRFDKQESILIGDSSSKMRTSQYSFEKFEANPLSETPAISKTSMVRSMVEHSLLTSLDEIQRVAAIGSGGKGKESSSTVDAVKLMNSCSGLKKTSFNSQSASGTTVLGRKAGKFLVAEESKERTISLNPLLHSSSHNDRAPLASNARVDNERAQSNRASFALTAKDSNNVGRRRLEVCENVVGSGAESNNLKLSLALNGLEIPWEEVEFQEQIEDSDNVGKISLEVGEDVEEARATSDNLELSLALDGLEIPWEELKLRERIGAGSFGTVYRADWHGSDVAVKIFMEQEVFDERRNEFVREIAIIKRMRHPNVVLFMGAVTKRPNLSIVTEYLPRGSLFRILHRSGVRESLDEKRRIRMALDVAKGMNYLHRLNPPIVHRDLKSPNLLVDKTWTVKVCDFGLSRFKANTFLSSRSAGGTPEWMAPEVLRDEPSNEKSDVYSFGVILWELITLQQPWSGLSPIQVVAAVGFQNRRLQIPKDLSLEIASLIESCWSSDPRQRPPFADIMEILKGFTKSPSLTLGGGNRSA